MTLDRAVYLDTYLMIFTLMLCIAFLIKYSRNNKIDWLVVLSYLPINFFSYNIMIKPIHDNNIIIFRNSFYHYKVLGPLSIADVFFLFLSCYFILKLLKKSKKLIWPVFNFLIVRDFIIAIISLFAFFITYKINYSFSDEFIYYRGIFYLLIPLLYFINKKNEKETCISTFYVLMWLDLIDIISSFISTRLFYEYVWERFGLRVTIIDQDTAYTLITFYTLVFLLSFLRQDHIFKRKKILLKYLVVIISGILTVINSYKAIFGVLLMALIIIVLTDFKRRKNFALVKVPLIILILIPTLYFGITYYASSQGIVTRSKQTSDLFEYLKNNNYLLHGVGFGGMYERSELTFKEDLGEIKAIDVQEIMYNGYFTKTYQVPYLNVLKNSGLLGLVIFSFLSLFIIQKLISYIKHGDVWLASVTIFFIYYLITGVFFLNPSPYQYTIIIKFILICRIFMPDTSVLQNKMAQNF